MKETQDLKSLSRLTRLTDDELLRRLSDVLKQSRRVESVLVAHIAEVDARRLFAREASPSMFQYAVDVLHLSKAEAYLRMEVNYNFVRPHKALRFGREIRTPAMQAGLAKRRLTFRDVLVCPPPSLLVSVISKHGAITCAVPSRLPTTPIVDELLAA